MEGNYRNPKLTVDIIVEIFGGIVLIERRNAPHGWALPGGFVDEGESLEDAAVRETLEETGLKARLKCQMHTYSDPARDPRFHTVSVVFVAEASGKPTAQDDARDVGIFTEDDLPAELAFDHYRILHDYFKWKRAGFNVFEY